MFDIGAAELLVIVVVAVIVIGPKDLPLAMRTAGRWIGKLRRVSAHFRSGIDTMVREAELEDMEAKWKAQNEAIMKRSPPADDGSNGEPVMTGPPLAPLGPPEPPSANATAPEQPARPSPPLPVVDTSAVQAPADEPAAASAPGK